MRRYPITPQTEVAEYMARRLPKVGGLCLQAESEVAAINMLMGASASGTRAMTSSSSPGISLKSEGISYIAGCDRSTSPITVSVHCTSAKSTLSRTDWIFTTSCLGPMMVTAFVTSFAML